MFGADKLQRKGIIPRAVEHIFKFVTEAEAEFAARPEANAGGIATVEVPDCVAVVVKSVRQQLNQRTDHRCRREKQLHVCGRRVAHCH